MRQLIKNCELCILGALFAVMVLLMLPSGCIVQPPPTAAVETVTSYNTLIIGLYGLIATAIAGILTQVAAILIGNRNARKIQVGNEESAKKSQEAIVAANHQNEKLMKLTENLIKTEAKSDATIVQVDKLKDAAILPVAATAPLIIVVPPHAAAAPASGTIAVDQATAGKAPDLDMTAKSLTVDTGGGDVKVSKSKPKKAKK